MTNDHRHLRRWRAVFVRRGFTLVELLVVIGIIGILMSLLLPAVQAAREAARKTECRNNLRQLGTAMVMHHDLHRHFPTDGWGFCWVGDPARGFNQQQPGGWVYNVLPFIEQQQLREIGAGLAEPDKRRAMATVVANPLSIFNCPSRRRAVLYPYNGRLPLRNLDDPPEAAKSDYAINGGDRRIDTGAGPDSTSVQDLRRYRWPNVSELTGIGFVLSTVRMADVLDGTSNTCMLGEKYISAAAYNEGHGGDDQTMYVGDDADIRRWCMDAPIPDASRAADKTRFGSAHRDIANFAFCDGSVRAVTYAVEDEVMRRLGNRHDGQPVDLTQLGH